MSSLSAREEIYTRLAELICVERSAELRGQRFEQEFEDALRLWDNPSFATRWFLVMSAWGRKPQA